MQTLFSKVDIKPGKPTTVGRIGRTWIVNLPGNPSAAAVNFEIFARSIIARLKGVNTPYLSPISTVCARDTRVKPGKFTVLIITTPSTDLLKAGESVRMIPVRYSQGSRQARELFT